MRLSTSTNICAFTPGRERNGFDFCVRVCAEAGYKVLDINLCEAMNPYSRLRGEDWLAYVDEIGELGARYGVTFDQSHLPYYDIFGNTDTEKAALMEELIRRSIIASGRLGVKWAVTHPGTVYSAGPDMSVSLKKNVEYYTPHLETAVKAGIGIALENEFEYKKRPFQRIYVSDPRELCGLIDAFGSPSVGACYDFGHGNLTGGFHRENLNILGRRLKAVHVADNCGEHDEHFMPFFGNVDWRAAMAGLADIGYEGDLTYEIQEFPRYLPNDLKHLAVELSLSIGRHLISLFEKELESRTTE